MKKGNHALAGSLFFLTNIKKYVIKHIFLHPIAPDFQERLYFCSVRTKNNRITTEFIERKDNRMKRLKRILRKIGSADKHIWGYVTL